jgi:hypothetical protein
MQLCESSIYDGISNSKLPGYHKIKAQVNILNRYSKDVWIQIFISIITFLGKGNHCWRGVGYNEGLPNTTEGSPSP